MGYVAAIRMATLTLGFLDPTMEGSRGTTLLDRKALACSICCPIGHGGHKRNCPHDSEDHVSHCRVCPELDGQAS